MRILVTGADGYEGWPLALHLTAQGHQVMGIDNLSRRKWVADVNGQSVLPVINFDGRRSAYDGVLTYANLQDGASIERIMGDWEPNAVIHLAEQPSAPYSMRAYQDASFTLSNNLVGTSNLLHAVKNKAPEAHLIYVSTMGEYGTPESMIPEGVFPKGSMWMQGDQPDTETWRGSLDGSLFPRKPGSFYHVSKVASSSAVEFACRTWGLRVSTLYQGVVYGVTHPKWKLGMPSPAESSIYATRLDVDEVFGTVLNRFCAQAVLAEPITLYGTGEQKRGFISLGDTVKSIAEIMLLPPEPGQQRHVNQLETVLSMVELAQIVKNEAAQLNIPVDIRQVPNPRVEAAKHMYEPSITAFSQLYDAEPYQTRAEVTELLRVMLYNLERLRYVRPQLQPKTQWR